ncbi:hypothetical protein DIPPA_01176 [Diplonema papillatum]|nr:hypothetical protein DIPPA_01176 [Diplonema papillatum]
MVAPALKLSAMERSGDREDGTGLRDERSDALLDESVKRRVLRVAALLALCDQPDSATLLADGSPHGSTALASLLATACHTAAP